MGSFCKMISFDEAKLKVLKSITDAFKPHDEAILLDKYTLTRKYGWIFSFTNKKYLQSKSIRHAYIGHGPILILKDSGEILEYGSAFSPELLANRIENEWKLWKLTIHSFENTNTEILKKIKDDFDLPISALIKMKSSGICEIEGNEEDLLRLQLYLKTFNFESIIVFQEENLVNKKY
jgi:hypothetical protein